MTTLSQIRDDIESVLASATKQPRPDRIRVIRETIEALSIESLFSAWLAKKYGGDRLEELDEQDLQEAFRYIKAVSSLMEPNENAVEFPLLRRGK